MLQESLLSTGKPRHFPLSTELTTFKPVSLIWG